jgi:flavorubredoxin
MAYNSYLLIDEKIAVIDTVDFRKKDEWMSNLKNALEGKTPDYLIVQHMEPDHSGSIDYFVKTFALFLFNTPSPYLHM